jgi:hypothetical protein
MDKLEHCSQPLAIISSQPDHLTPSQQQLRGLTALESSNRRNSNAQIRDRAPIPATDLPALIIDAPDITTACQEAVEDDDWESAEEDGDGSGATTINAAREIPEGLIEQTERGNVHSGSFLWEDQPEYGPRLEIPAQFTNDE